MSPISGLVGEPIRVPWIYIKGCSGQKERERVVRRTVPGYENYDTPSPLKLPSNIHFNTFKAKKEQGFLFWFCIFVFFILVL
jgi:hypothetical protein